jgi:hypothetical protein
MNEIWPSNAVQNKNTLLRAVLFTDDDLYIMQRSGSADRSGLLFVLNNRGSWNSMWVQTR